MIKRELVVEINAFEARIAIIENGDVIDLIIERASGASLIGNIYLGHIQRVVNSIGAAFVDIGFSKSGFLPLRGGEAVTEGDAVCVQVTRDAFSGKGPQLSLNLTVPGRLLVYGPSADRITGSRKIDNEAERQRLLSIVKGIAAEKEGFIVRTVGEGASQSQIETEADNLREIWTSVDMARSDAKAPSILYEDIDLLQKILRDHVQGDASVVWFEDRGALHIASQFCKRFMPELMGRLQLYDGPNSLFEEFRVEDAIDEALEKKVRLTSGGSIVIECTEALTAIDVNSDRFTEGSDPHDNALRTNLEAAIELARQVRLRNIGGLIVIDFIGLEDPGDWEEILETLKTGFLTDRNHSRIVGKTEAGLVEVIRRRRRRPLAEILMGDCHECDGAGQLRNAETTAYDTLRAVRRESRDGLEGPLTICVAPAVAEILTNVESRNGFNPLDHIGRKVTIRPVTDFAVDEFDVFIEEKGTQACGES